MSRFPTFPPEDLSAAFAFRAELLGAARTRVFTHGELVHASRMLYGHPEGLSVYGVSAPRMTGRGLRLLGRTVIECTVDDHCVGFVEVLAGCRAREPRMRPGFVADLFCGSGNFGWHLGRRLGLPVFAAELDPAVHAATRHNVEVMDLAIELRHADYRQLLDELPAHSAGDIYVVEPPWGPAYTEHGLDFEATAPPVPEILSAIQHSRAGRQCLVVTQTIVVGAHDQVTRPSLARCFRNARHLASFCPPTTTLRGGVGMEFHVYVLPG